MQYIISEDLITFHRNGETCMVSPATNSYFDVIKQTLLDNRELKNSWLSLSGRVSEASDGLFTYADRQYFYQGEVVPSSLGKQVLSLHEAKLPYQPLVNFWKKVKQHSSRDIQAQLCDLAGSRGTPLTWDGDLVLYTRASWVPSLMEEAADPLNPTAFRPMKADWSGNFEPGKVVSSAKDTLPCGDFDWITNACPDQGAIYDIQVHPCNVVKLSQSANFSRSPGVGVREFRYLSQLEECSELAEKVCFINVETNNLGELLVVRKPYSLESMGAYLNSLVTGSNSMERTEVVTVTAGGC